MVPSPDGTRLLARPNGLAGWALPRIAVAVPFAGWDDASLAAAAAAIGTAVRPLDAVGSSAWAVEVDRVGAAGNTWIGALETARLGNDAGVADEWFARRRGEEG